MQRVMGQSTVSKARQPGKSWWVVYLDAAAGAESIDHLALLAEVRISAVRHRLRKSTVAWQERSASIRAVITSLAAYTVRTNAQLKSKVEDDLFRQAREITETKRCPSLLHRFAFVDAALPSAVEPELVSDASQQCAWCLGQVSEPGMASENGVGLHHCRCVTRDALSCDEPLLCSSGAAVTAAAMHPLHQAQLHRFAHPSCTKARLLNVQCSIRTAPRCAWKNCSIGSNARRSSSSRQTMRS